MYKVISILTISILIAAIFFIGCRPEIEKGVTEEQAKMIIDGYLQFRNNGDLAAADRILSPDCVINYPNMPEPVKGLDAFKEYDKTMRAALPDFNMTIDSYFIKDDMIISYWTLNATHTGPLGELPPTNKKVNISGIAVSKIADGKMVEDVAYFNTLDLMQQLGYKLVPPEVQSK